MDIDRGETEIERREERYLINRNRERATKRKKKRQRTNDPTII